MAEMVLDEYGFLEEPYCNRYYELEYEEYDYCPHCGQRIDFGE